MKKWTRWLPCVMVVLTCLLTWEGPAAAQDAYFGSNNTNFVYFGRVRQRSGSGTPYGKEGAAINYVGSGFNVKFSGSTKVALQLTSFGGQYDAGPNPKPIDLVITIDGVDKRFSLASPYAAYYQNYTITTNLSTGQHTLQLRRVADTQNQVTFHGLILSSGATLQSGASLPSRRIEFYGDSVTSGGSVEPAVASPNPNNDGDYRQNNDLTFGVITAKNFAADYRFISQGGAGLHTGYSLVPLRNFWNQWDFDGFNRSDDPAATYNLSQWQPRIVVVGIGHNDRQRGVSRSDWISTYSTLITNLKNSYPGADIICMNTMISDPSDGWWDAAIDPHVYSGSRVHKLRFTVQNHSGHPHVADHQFMANALTQKIKSITGWNATPVGRRIGIKSNANNYFVASNQSWNTYLQASGATAIGNWEKFDVVDAGNGDVALRSVQTGKYVTTDLNQMTNQLRADWASSIMGWEKFRWEVQSDGSFALKSLANNLYVSSNQNENGALQARSATTVGSWEKFSYVDQGNF